MSDIAIKIDHLTKVYKIFAKPTDRVKEALNPFGKRYSTDFYALKDLNIEIPKGETVGIIGKNGAGKSTLLKLITGVLTPTSGNIQVNGKIASLLELGAGFNPEMTGIENIYMNGNIMGYTSREMDEKVQDIVAFADIGDFINQPVKMYSSGMFARLAFAMNAFIDPDILIVDEALSVGDAFFQAKCINKMQNMIKKGVTVLFVSHDTFAVKNLCKRAIYLEKGTKIMDGEADEVIEEYRNRQIEQENCNVKRMSDEKNILASEDSQIGLEEAYGFGSNAIFSKKASYQRIGNGRITFYNVRLLDEQEAVVDTVTFGQTVILRMSIKANDDIDDIVGHGYHLRDYTGIDLVYSDSAIRHSFIENPKKGDLYVVDYKFRMLVKEGNYTIATVLSIPIDIPNGVVNHCDFVPCAVQFTVLPKITERLHGGFVNLMDEVSCIKLKE